MGNLLKHAESELNLIGMGEKTKDPMNRLMHDNIIQIIKIFEKQGHSGASANYAINNLYRLLKYEPISSLTGEDDEWNEVGDGVWQNKRCSKVFKEADGRAYDIEGIVWVDKNGSTWTNHKSRVYITFPYVPKTKYIKRRWWKFWL